MLKKERILVSNTFRFTLWLSHVAEVQSWATDYAKPVFILAIKIEINTHPEEWL